MAGAAFEPDLDAWQTFKAWNFVRAVFTSALVDFDGSLSLTNLHTIDCDTVLFVSSSVRFIEAFPIWIQAFLNNSKYFLLLSGRLSVR